MSTMRHPFTASAWRRAWPALLILALALSMLTGCSDDTLLGPAASDEAGRTAIATAPNDQIVAGEKIGAVPINPMSRYLQDSYLTGDLDPVLDADDNVVGWNVAINGTHYATPVSYTGAIVADQFTPQLPGLPWLVDGAEFLPAYEEGFIPLSNDPDALLYRAVGQGIIDAPLSDTTWGRGYGKSGLNTELDRAAPATQTEVARELNVTVYDPQSGKPLNRSAADDLLRRRGWTEGEIEALFRGDAAGCRRALAEKGDELQVSVSASVTLELSVPPFAKISVTGTITLTGPLSAYDEMAIKAAQLADDLAHKLLDKMEAQLKELKKLLKRIAGGFAEWWHNLDLNPFD